jgi:YesN/AraC family two-component response regulator
MPRALIVDDEADIRLLLRAIIEDADHGLEVVAEAENGTNAIERCREVQPDIVVLDQRMPDVTGLQAAERILAERPDQPIILFSAYLDAEMMRAASALGVRACISKQNAADIPAALWKHSA